MTNERFESPSAGLIAIVVHHQIHTPALSFQHDALWPDLAISLDGHKTWYFPGTIEKLVLEGDVKTGCPKRVGTVSAR